MTRALPAVRLASFVVLGAMLWGTWLWRCADILKTFAQAEPREEVWLYDWNVYHAAANDFMQRTLYRVPLLQPGYELPIEAFNYPPLAAGLAVPLLPLGREPGGIVWLIVGVMAVAVGALYGSRALGLRWSLAWPIAGAALVAYSRAPSFAADLLLGNNSHLVFALAAGFAVTHLRGHERVAGILLALAIGTKLWPVAFMPLLIRERRWTAVRWTVGVLAVQGVLTLLWLGPDFVGSLASAVVGQNYLRREHGEIVLWTTAFRVWWEWWPAWGGYLVAVVLVLIPAGGRLGLGLAVLAGLSLNANVWHHYAPVFVLALALIGAGALRRSSLRAASRAALLIGRRGLRGRADAQG